MCHCVTDTDLDHDLAVCVSVCARAHILFPAAERGLNDFLREFGANIRTQFQGVKGRPARPLALSPTALKLWLHVILTVYLKTPGYTWKLSG